MRNYLLELELVLSWKAAARCLIWWLRVRSFYADLAFRLWEKFRLFSNKRHFWVLLESLLLREREKWNCCVNEEQTRKNICGLITRKIMKISWRKTTNLEWKQKATKTTNIILHIDEKKRTKKNWLTSTN